MPSTKLRTKLAIGEVNRNVLAGTDFEFLSAPSLVTFALSATAADIEATIKANNEDLASDVIPNVEQAVGRVVLAEDMVIDGELLGAGTRLKIRAVGGAAAGFLNTFVKIEPIPAGIV